MDSADPFGKAILHLLRRQSISRETLCARAKIKKETLEGAINGTSKVRPATRNAIIDKGFKVSNEFFLAIEQAISREQDPLLVLEPNAAKDGNTRLLEQIVEKIEGLTLPVARSILRAFEEDGAEKDPFEIEIILRRKAMEYVELKKQIAMLAGGDLRVQQLRDDALTQLDGGHFEEALTTLEAAQKIDHVARIEVERSIGSRRISEAETGLSRARISGLLSRYPAAADLAIEACQIARGMDASLEERALVEAARYLDRNANEFGEAGSERTSIARIEHGILPLLPASSRLGQLSIQYYLADLHSLIGYRNGDKTSLAVAAAIFRSNLELLSQTDEYVMKLHNGSRLGDTTVEMALAATNIVEGRRGIAVMRHSIAETEKYVPEIDAANAYIRMGTALCNLGLLTEDAQEFQDAVTAYNAAIRLYKPIMDKAVWARAQWGLGAAFLELGRTTRSVEILKRSERASVQAMEYLTRERAPIEWATILANKGNARLERGKLENGLASFKKAIADFDIALEIRTESRFPLGFARTFGNRAIALGHIAERTGNLDMARGAKKDLGHVVSLLDDGSYWKQEYVKAAQMVSHVIGDQDELEM